MTAESPAASTIVALSEEQVRDIIEAITKAVREQPAALTAAHAAAYLDMAESTFRRLASAKLVPSPAVIPGLGNGNGKANRWLRKDLDEWLAKHRRKR